MKVVQTTLSEAEHNLGRVRQEEVQDYQGGCEGNSLVSGGGRIDPGGPNILQVTCF